MWQVLRADAQDERKMANMKTSRSPVFAAAILLGAVVISHAQDKAGLKSPLTEQAQQQWCKTLHAQDYAGIAEAYADYMIEHGRDRYGKVHSPLFMTVLKRKTGKLFKAPYPHVIAKPYAPGLRRDHKMRPYDRTYIGSNPLEDLPLYGLLYRLSELTDDSCYRQEADKSIAWFLENAWSPKTKLPGWGSHMYYQVEKDVVVFAGGNPNRGYGGHEYNFVWPYWDQHPYALNRFAQAVWNEHIRNKETGHFNRHSNDGSSGMEFPETGSCFMEVWARAYGRSGDPEMKEHVQTLLKLFRSLRDPNTGAMGWCSSKDTGRRELSNVHMNLSMATTLQDAAQHVAKRDPELAGELCEFVRFIDDEYLSNDYDHILDVAGKGILGWYLVADRSARFEGMTPAPDGVDSSVGFPVQTTDGKPAASLYYLTPWFPGRSYAEFGIKLKKRHMRCEAKHRATYRRALMDIADIYLCIGPEVQFAQYPDNVSDVVELLRYVYRLTGELTYLHRADQMMRLGLRLFFDETSPLPKITNFDDWYESSLKNESSLEILRQMLELSLDLEALPEDQRTAPQVVTEARKGMWHAKLGGAASGMRLQYGAEKRHALYLSQRKGPKHWRITLSDTITRIPSVQEADRLNGRMDKFTGKGFATASIAYGGFKDVPRQVRLVMRNTGKETATVQVTATLHDSYHDHGQVQSDKTLKPGEAGRFVLKAPAKRWIRHLTIVSNSEVTDLSLDAMAFAVSPRNQLHTAIAPEGWPERVESIQYTASVDETQQPAVIYTARSVSENPVVGPRASGFVTGKDGEAGDIGAYRRCSRTQSSRETSRSKPDRILRQAPRAGTKRPLLVGLHTWSSTYDSAGGDAAYARWCIENDWHFIHPHFRGPNWTPDACGSEKMVQDVLDAVAHMQKTRAVDPSRIYLVGVSGGGHAALLMAGRAPELWAGVSAWASISDIRAWWEQKTHGIHAKYAQHIEKAVGGRPDENGRAAAECVRRSPVTYLHQAAGVNLDINAGITDGHKGSVPFTHSLHAFNATVADSDRLRPAFIQACYDQQAIPVGTQTPAPDPLYGEKAVLFRKVSGNTRVTIFRGGHEIIARAALHWLAAQRKGKPAFAPSPSRPEKPQTLRKDWGPFVGPWKRHEENPIIKLEGKESYSIQNGPQSVIHWKDKWHMFLMTSQPMVTKLAQSDDGLTWKRPHHNYLLQPEMPWEGSYNLAKAAVVRDDEVWLYYFGKKAKTEMVSLARSNDLVNWQKEPKPIFTHQDSRIDGTRAFPDCVIQEGDTWYMYYDVGYDYHHPKNPDGYAIGVATSPDGINWTDSPKSPVLTVSERTPDSWDDGMVSQCSVHKIGHWFYMLYSGSTNKHGRKYSGKNRMAFGLARARYPEGPWEKYPDNPVFAPTGNEEDFDGIFLQHACPVKVGDQWRLYYNGWTLHPEAKNTIGAEYAIGLAFAKVLLAADTGKKTHYYVDAARGDDKNLGTSVHTAWKTLAPVNATPLAPSDKVLLKAGCEFTGPLRPKGCGTEGKPIVIDKYGEGSNPIINGEGKIENTIRLHNQHHWEMRNLTVTNTDGGAWDDEGRTIRRALYVTAEDAGDVEHIHLKNLEIRNVRGMYRFAGNETNGGIICQVLGDEESTRFVDLRIEDCVFRSKSIDRYPVVVTSSWKKDPACEVVWKNNTLDHTGRAHIVIPADQWPRKLAYYFDPEVRKIFPLDKTAPPVSPFTGRVGCEDIFSEMAARVKRSWTFFEATRAAPRSWQFKHSPGDKGPSLWATSSMTLAYYGELRALGFEPPWMENEDQVMDRWISGINTYLSPKTNLLSGPAYGAPREDPAYISHSYDWNSRNRVFTADRYSLPPGGLHGGDPLPSKAAAVKRFNAFNWNGNTYQVCNVLGKEMKSHAEVLRAKGVDPAKDEIIMLLHTMLDAKFVNGRWGRGGTADGNMKMAVTYCTYDWPIPDHKALVDFTLDGANGQFKGRGCQAFNQMWVLAEARRQFPDGYRGDEIDESLAQSFLTFQENWNEKLNFYSNNWSGKHNNGVPLFISHLMLDLPIMRGSAVYNWREAPIITRGKDGMITRNKVTYVTPGHLFYD
jgi:poly(3-hydroxybutyrate) depolymerase